MTPQQPSFALFLHTVSSIATHGTDPRTVVEQILERLHVDLGDARASIELRIPASLPDVFVSVGSRNQEEGRLTFARPIAVRGVEYGRVSVEVGTPPVNPAEWMWTLETLTQQLALFAERVRLVGERRRDLRELRTRKALSRASGIVAASRGVAMDEARRWLVSEASRRGSAVHVLAEQVILRHDGAIAA